jgi:hypothetical protein
VIASLRSWSETTGDGRERLYGQSHHGRGCTHLKSLCFCELRHKYVKMRSSLGHLAMMSGEVQRKKLWDDGTMGRWESCPLIPSSHHPIIPSSRHPVSSCRTNCSAPEGQRATAASTRSTSVSPSSIHGRRAGDAAPAVLAKSGAPFHGHRRRRVQPHVVVRVMHRVRCRHVPSGGGSRSITLHIVGRAGATRIPSA